MVHHSINIISCNVSLCRECRLLGATDFSVLFINKTLVPKIVYGKWKDITVYGINGVNFKSHGKKRCLNGQPMQTSLNMFIHTKNFIFKKILGVFVLFFLLTLTLCLCCCFIFNKQKA